MGEILLALAKSGLNGRRDERTRNEKAKKASLTDRFTVTFCLVRFVSGIDFWVESRWIWSISPFAWPGS